MLTFLVIAPLLTASISVTVAQSDDCTLHLPDRSSKVFGSCQTLVSRDGSADFELFSSLSQDEKTVELGIRGPATGYLAVGLPDEAREMVPADAAVGFVTANSSSVQAMQYSLQKMSSLGVQPAGTQKFRFPRKFLDKDNAMTFIVKISVGDFPEKLKIGAKNDIIWAMGEAPETGRSLEYHTSRGFGTLELVKAPQGPGPGAVPETHQNTTGSNGLVLVGLAAGLVTLALLASTWRKRSHPQHWTRVSDADM